jgi:hypothetical protein
MQTNPTNPKTMQTNPTKVSLKAAIFVFSENLLRLNKQTNYINETDRLTDEEKNRLILDSAIAMDELMNLLIDRISEINQY